MTSEALKPRPTCPIVPVGPYARAVEWLGQQGVPQGELLARAGIPPEELSKPRGFLTVDQVEALALAGAEMVGRPGLALGAGGVTLFPSYGHIGIAVLTAPSLGAAFSVAQRYQDLVTPLFLFEQEGDDQTTRVRVRTRYRLHPEAYRIHLEFLISTMFEITRHGVGRVPEGVRLMLPATRAHLTTWLENRGVAVHPSDDGETILELPRELTKSPFLMADATTHAAFVALCEQAMQDLELRDTMTRAVRAALRDSRPPFPTFEAVCRRVGASARTVRRRLVEEGTGYQELFDEARFTWATQALQFTRRPVTQIAYELGYSAPSSFTRAFRRAVGTNPSAFRTDERE